MKVFISHAFTETQLAKRVADTLKEAGFQVWDETQVWPGDNWAASLSQALEESEAMVVLLTPDSVRSTNVTHEISYALGQHKYKGRLIPVVAAPAEAFDSSKIPWVFNLKPFQIVRAPNLAEDEDSRRTIARALQAAA